ncbi:citrate lyase subunit alpha, partial [Escherichia coli]|uniref:citrate lyase subunit alpha n=1 Tax=Escherichia coli TaxID=562 RepID=UPI003DA70555
MVQGAFNHFPGMDFRAVDGAGEEGFTGNQLILVIQIAAWNRRAECDLAAFQNSPKQTYQAEKARDRKLCANLEEAIRRSGLQDGMTVSFHHAFRGGDLTVNMVMDVIAKMGFKNLTLASSSLS